MVPDVRTDTYTCDRAWYIGVAAIVAATAPATTRIVIRRIETHLLRTMDR